MNWNKKSISQIQALNKNLSKTWKIIRENVFTFKQYRLPSFWRNFQNFAFCIQNKNITKIQLSRSAQKVKSKIVETIHNNSKLTRFARKFWWKKKSYLNFRTQHAECFPVRLLVTTTNSTSSPSARLSLPSTSLVWKKSFLPSSTS